MGTCLKKSFPLTQLCKKNRVDDGKLINNLLIVSGRLFLDKCDFCAVSNSNAITQYAQYTECNAYFNCFANIQLSKFPISIQKSIAF